MQTLRLLVGGFLRPLGNSGLTILASASLNPLFPSTALYPAADLYPSSN